MISTQCYRASFMDPIYERNVGKDKVLRTAAPFVYSYHNWKEARTKDGTLDKVERKEQSSFLDIQHILELL